MRISDWSSDVCSSDLLILAASIDQPQTLWASRTGDYSMFGRSTPIADDDAFTATMNARQLNEIVDLIPKQHLLALTVGGVWKLGGSKSDVLTPTTFRTRPQPSTVANSLEALYVGETEIYFTNKGRKDRDLAYTFDAPASD